MSKQSSTFFGVILALLALVHSVQALNEAASASGNKYPIVLLHGFAGWGRDELGGAKYWGGFHGDWQEDLKKAGYDIRTATVGPFASNWDRACELYAYIKGGTVYYGKNHAQTHNHKLTGRTYPGIFPQWGEVINGEVQKIHIVAHSMGGQTARMLAQLLAEGTKGAPIQEDPNSHPLFAGGKDWIHSISTFATPNQGTLLADGFDTFGDAVENLVGAIVGSVNAFGGGVSMLYDTKLDQWGLSPRQNGENLKDYIKRVFNSPVLKNAGKDLCLYSLSAAGAKEELTWVKTQPKIYYYSATNSDSFRLGSIQLPRPQSMLLPLQPLSVFLGSSYATKKGYSSAWQENDGVVNTPSMKSDGKAQVVEGVAVSAPGRWHHIGLFNTLDHEAVVGVKLFVNILNVYTAQARILYELPATKVGRRLRSASVELAHSEEATRRVSEAVAAVNAPVEPTKEQILAVCAQPANDAVRLACEPHMRRL